MAEILERMNRIVWGAPALVLILGVGLYLSFRTGFAQLTLFPAAMKHFFGQFRRRETTRDGVSPFRALCTALAATVGTGNLAGVAGAIALGGPGAVFWMWICGFLGMALKYAEATLAVRCRTRDRNGEYVGGPMYMIRASLGRRWQWLGMAYAFFGVVAAFGVGNATQINAVVVSFDEMLAQFGIVAGRRENLLLGLLLGPLVGMMLLGGARRIGAAAEGLVPLASVSYLLLGLGVLVVRADQIPGAFAQILEGAFSPRAVTGGILGSAFTALRVGVSRGVFTNEAGMGTASMAHAGAAVSHPAEQGLMGIVEVFVDTILICTMTALVILCGGAEIPYGTDPGVALTVRSFRQVYGGWIGVYLSAALMCFAFATVLGWGLYGIRCAQFLLGEGAWKGFALLQAVVVVLGAVLETRTLWAMSELVNGLMAIPNLIVLLALAPEVRRLTIEYRTKRKPGKMAGGGTYENFHQRESLRTVPHAQIPSSGGGSGKKGPEDLPSEHWSAGSAHAGGVL